MTSTLYWMHWNRRMIGFMHSSEPSWKIVERSDRTLPWREPTMRVPAAQANKIPRMRSEEFISLFIIPGLL